MYFGLSVVRIEKELQSVVLVTAINTHASWQGERSLLLGKQRFGGQYSACVEWDP